MRETKTNFKARLKILFPSQPNTKSYQEKMFLFSKKVRSIQRGHSNLSILVAKKFLIYFNELEIKLRIKSLSKILGERKKNLQL